MGADIDFFKLQKDYSNFMNPRVVIEVEGKNIDKSDIGVGEVDLELTSGFEASIATFNLYNTFSQEKYAFDY
ncbi:MAG: hypothetical protein K6F00_02235, partial [Lachnospiraceae bacterium]|nr:hypothetical protein [Lachnospiraceae bacterium]